MVSGFVAVVVRPGRLRESRSPELAALARGADLRETFHGLPGNSPGVDGPPEAEAHPDSATLQRDAAGKVIPGHRRGDLANRPGEERDGMPRIEFRLQGRLLE